MRPSRKPKRFYVWWVAQIRAWQLTEDDGRFLLGQAMELVSGQDGTDWGSCEFDDETVCFKVITSEVAPVFARATAIRGLRAALGAAGIGLEHSSQWSPLVLELDPTALDLQPIAVLDYSAL